MKSILLTAALAVGLAIPVVGQQAYKTLTATGTTASATYFPADPAAQIRVVGAVCTSDLAGSGLSLSSGVGAYTIVSNATSSATVIYISATNGLVAGDALVLQTWGNTNGYNTVASVTVSNAVTINSGGFGVAVTAGDQFYKMGSTSTLPVGAATANYQGVALFVGNKGRPVRATLNGTSTNTINSLTAAYE